MVRQAVPTKEGLDDLPAFAGGDDSHPGLPQASTPGDCRDDQRQPHP